MDWRPQLTNLPDQFGPVQGGRVLILDGDGPLYAVSATVKTLPTAIRRARLRILELIFLTSCSKARVHLTAQTSYKGGRFSILAAKPYQGNRKGKEKPALLEPLREALALQDNWLPEFEVIMHHRVEADDGMMIDAHTLGDDGVIWSEDKDLRMTPYPYFDRDTGQTLAGVGFGHTAIAYTEGGSSKLTGQGRKFFWLQMLAGDTADNIKGLQRCNGALIGPERAVEFLAALADENKVANAVVDAYRAIDQNPIPEAYLLWLLRTPNDHVWSYFQGLQWSPENTQFLIDCSKRKWYDTDYPPTPGYACSGEAAYA